MATLLLFVRHTDGRLDPLEVDANGSVNDILVSLKQRGQLQFQGELLSPETLLADSGISKESVVEFISSWDYTVKSRFQPDDCEWWYNGLMFNVVPKKTGVRLKAVRFAALKDGEYRYSMYVREGGYAESPRKANHQAGGDVVTEAHDWTCVATDVKLTHKDKGLERLEAEKEVYVEPGKQLGVYIHSPTSESAICIPHVDGSDDAWPVTHDDDHVLILPGPRTESSEPFQTVDNRCYHIHGFVELQFC
eukprot:Hpha_TRINITY_DN23760_c0_g1::TRINITY_DN23760_c0_g1_i1::g.93189::m.93189